MRHVFAFLCLFLSITPNLVLHAKPTCPSAKDIISADTPSGVFGKTIWSFIEFKDSKVDYTNSILIISEEKKKAEKSKITGYVWFRQDGKVIGCVRVNGEHLITEHEVSLRVRKTSLRSIPINTHFEATLSDDKRTLSGTMSGLFRESGQKRKTHRHSKLLDENLMVTRRLEWQATKIYPVPSQSESEPTNVDP